MYGARGAGPAMSEAGEPRRAGSEPGPGGGQGDAALAVPKPGWLVRPRGRAVLHAAAAAAGSVPLLTTTAWASDR